MPGEPGIDAQEIGHAGLGHRLPHRRCSLARAPARSPSARPAASATALTAPALVALIQPMSSVSSSSRRSSTPQVKAPCAPPPSERQIEAPLAARNRKQ